MPLKRILICLSFLSFVCILAACGESSTASPTSTATTAPTTIAGSGSGKPGKAPIVISTITPVVGGGTHSQQVHFDDRTLIITDVSKQAGMDASSVGISVSITIKNNSDKAILNQDHYYQLVGSEGDTFGLQSKVTAGFYGSIEARGSRTGTIIFQVPSGATQNLRMFYRSEIAAETVFMPLGV